MTSSPTDAPRKTPRPTRRLARLAAAQALYQIDLTGRDPARVAEEFVRLRLDDVLGADDGEPAQLADKAWFDRIVRGTWASHGRLDPLIERHLAAGWTLERAGFPFRACLRAGAFELAECPDVPVSVVINEYIEVARALLPGEEPSVVHAILDRLARHLRVGAPTG